MRRARKPETMPNAPLSTAKMLGIVAAVAGVARLVYFVLYLRSPLAGYHIVDQAYYLDWAKQIAAGDWLGSEVFEQGPLYPYLLGIFLRVIGDHLNIVIFLQLLVGMATALLTSLCARRLFDANIGLAAGLIAALYGPLVFYECRIMKSFLEPALTILSFYAAIRYRQDCRFRWLVPCGGSIGLACLLRESHILLAIPAALATAFPATTTAPLPTRGKRLIAVGVLAVATLLPILPSAVRNYRVAGEWIWVTAGGGEVFYMAHGPRATGYYSPPEFITARPPREHEDFRREAQRRTGQKLTRGESSRYWFHEGLNEIAAHPLRMLRLTCVKAAVLLNNFEVPDSASYAIARDFVPLLLILPSFGWIAGLGAWGIVLCLRRWREQWLPVAYVVAYALPVLLLYNFGRFRIGMMPIWIVLAAYGLLSIVRGWRSGANRWQAAAGLLVAGVFTLIAFLPPLGYTQMDYRLGSLLLKGSLSRRAGDNTAAERAFQQALELARQAFDAEGQRRGGQFRAARKLAEAHLELASLYRSENRSQEALAHFTAAVEVQPDSLEAHYNLANLLLAGGQTAAAIEQYEQAIVIDPDDVDTLINLGGALVGAGRLDEATERLQTALAIDPRRAKALYNLANARLLQGQIELAVEHYRQSLAIDAANPDVHNNLGQAYLKLNRVPEAMTQFRAALALENNHANARINLARTLDSQGNRAEAISEYARALEMFPFGSPQADAINSRLRELRGQ